MQTHKRNLQAKQPWQKPYQGITSRRNQRLRQVEKLFDDVPAERVFTGLGLQPDMLESADIPLGCWCTTVLDFCAF